MEVLNFDSSGIKEIKVRYHNSKHLSIKLLTQSQLTKFVIAKIYKDFIKTNGRKLRHFVSLFIILKKKKNIFLHYKQEFVGKNVDLPLTMSFIYLNKKSSTISHFLIIPNFLYFSIIFKFSSFKR